jgi:hypothetical protein
MVVSRNPSKVKEMKAPKHASAAVPTAIEKMVMKLRRTFRKTLRTASEVSSSIAATQSFGHLGLLELKGASRNLAQPPIAKLQEAVGRSGHQRVVGRADHGDSLWTCHGFVPLL